MSYWKGALQGRGIFVSIADQWMSADEVRYLWMNSVGHNNPVSPFTLRPVQSDIGGLLNDLSTFTVIRVGRNTGGKSQRAEDLSSEFYAKCTHSFA